MVFQRLLVFVATGFWVRSSLWGRVKSHLFLHLQFLAQYLIHSKSSTNIEGTNGPQMKHHVERGDPLSFSH